MIDFKLIYESAIADMSLVDQRLRNLRRRYEAYRKDHQTYDDDVEGLPVKPISKNNNYFKNFCLANPNLVGIENIIEEFANDKKAGRRRRRWNRIDVHQYESILERFVKHADVARIPEKLVYEQLDKICECTLDLIALETIMNIVNENIDDTYVDVAPLYEDYTLHSILKTFKSCFGENVTIDDVEILCEELEEWAAFSDHKCTSDYGTLYAMSILGNLDYNPTINDGIVALNKCVDLFHASNELALAFIDGGANALNTIRYGRENIKDGVDHITNEKVSVAEEQRLLDNLRNAILKTYQSKDISQIPDVQTAKQIAGMTVYSDNKSFVNDVNASQPLNRKLRRVAEEILANERDIMHESDVRYQSNEVKYIIYWLRWMINGKYHSEQAARF